MIDAESEAVKIPKFGVGKSHSGVPKPKESVTPPPVPCPLLLTHDIHPFQNANTHVLVCFAFPRQDLLSLCHKPFCLYPQPLSW